MPPTAKVHDKYFINSVLENFFTVKLLNHKSIQVSAWLMMKDAWSMLCLCGGIVLYNLLVGDPYRVLGNCLTNYTMCYS